MRSSDPTSTWDEGTVARDPVMAIRASLSGRPSTASDQTFSSGDPEGFANGVRGFRDKSAWDSGDQVAYAGPRRRDPDRLPLVFGDRWNLAIGAAAGIFVSTCGTAVTVPAALVVAFGVCVGTNWTRNICRGIVRTFRGKTDKTTKASDDAKMKRAASFDAVGDRLAARVGCTPFLDYGKFLKKTDYTPPPFELKRTNLEEQAQAAAAEEEKEALKKAAAKVKKGRQAGKEKVEGKEEGKEKKKEPTEYEKAGEALATVVGDLLHNLDQLRPRHLQSEHAETSDDVSLVANKLYKVVKRLGEINVQIAEDGVAANFESSQRPEHAQLLCLAGKLLSLLKPSEPSGKSPIGWEKLEESEKLAPLIKDDKGLIAVFNEFEDQSYDALEDEHFQLLEKRTYAAIPQICKINLRMVKADGDLHEGIKQLHLAIVAGKIDGQDNDGRDVYPAIAVACDAICGIVQDKSEYFRRISDSGITKKISNQKREELRLKLYEEAINISKGWAGWVENAFADGSLAATVVTPPICSRVVDGVNVSVKQLPGGDVIVGITSNTTLAHQIELNQALRRSHFAARWSRPGWPATRFTPRAISDAGFAILRGGRELPFSPKPKISKKAEMVLVVDCKKTDPSVVVARVEAFVQALQDPSVRASLLKGCFNTSTGPLHALVGLPGVIVNRMAGCNQAGLHLPAPLERIEDYFAGVTDDGKDGGMRLISRDQGAVSAKNAVIEPRSNLAIKVAFSDHSRVTEHAFDAGDGTTEPRARLYGPNGLSEREEGQPTLKEVLTAYQSDHKCSTKAPSPPPVPPAAPTATPVTQAATPPPAASTTPPASAANAAAGAQAAATPPPAASKTPPAPAANPASGSVSNATPNSAAANPSAGQSRATTNSNTASPTPTGSSSPASTAEAAREVKVEVLPPSEPKEKKSWTGLAAAWVRMSIKKISQGWQKDSGADPVPVTDPAPAVHTTASAQIKLPPIIVQPVPPTPSTATVVQPVLSATEPPAASVPAEALGAKVSATTAPLPRPTADAAAAAQSSEVAQPETAPILPETETPAAKPLSSDASAPDDSPAAQVTREVDQPLADPAAVTSLSPTSKLAGAGDGEALNRGIPIVPVPPKTGVVLQQGPSATNRAGEPEAPKVQPPEPVSWASVVSTVGSFFRSLFPKPSPSPFAKPGEAGSVHDERLRSSKKVAAKGSDFESSPTPEVRAALRINLPEPSPEEIAARRIVLLGRKVEDAEGELRSVLGVEVGGAGKVGAALYQVAQQKMGEASQLIELRLENVQQIDRDILAAVDLVGAADANKRKVSLSYSAAVREHVGASRAVAVLSQRGIVASDEMKEVSSKNEARLAAEEVRLLGCETEAKAALISAESTLLTLRNSKLTADQELSDAQTAHKSIQRALDLARSAQGELDRFHQSLGESKRSSQFPPPNDSSGAAAP